MSGPLSSFLKQATRYFFISLIVAAATLVLLSVIITIFYGKEVENYVVEKINSRLTAKVSVRDINFSILKSFPYASLEFNSVFATDPLSAANNIDTLFFAEGLTMKFNVLNIFRKNYSIGKIAIHDGVIYMKVDTAGADNFHVLKPSADSSSSEQGINLREILMKNVRYKYTNIKEKFLVSTDINQASLSGKFADEQFLLSAECDLLIEKLLSGKEIFLSSRHAGIVLSAEVNTSTGSFGISSGKINLNKLSLDVSGNVVTKNKERLFSFLIKSDRNNLKELAELVPPSGRKHFQNFRYEGNGNFKAAISGNTGEMKSVSLLVTGEIMKGKIRHKENSQALENVNAKCVYESNISGKRSASSLNVASFTASLDGKPVRGNFRIDDFKNPYLSLNASADIDLNMLRQFVPMDTLASLSGNAAINISYAGKISDAADAGSSLNTKIKASGTLAIRDMDLSLKNNPLQFTSISGNFIFKDNTVEANSFTGKISTTDFSMRGKIENLVPFLMLPNQPAAIIASLRSHSVNLDELLERGSSSSSDTTYKLSFSPGLTLTMTVDIDNLSFRKFKSQNISGVFKLRNKLLSSDELSFSSMKGKVKLRGEIDATRQDSLLISCSAKIKGLDIHELFYEVENFRQQMLTEKNLRGITDVEMEFASKWSTALIINPKSVVVDGTVKIYNGELLDFSPILALSRFVKVSELQHVKFSALQNRIQIYDRKIIIPSMEIKSSALNLTASGMHTFDNKVDYSLKLLLSDVLGKKAKENNSEFGYVEDDGLGRASLFLHMTGDAGNPKFTYDKKAVMKKIQSDIKTEKQTLKELLKKEFGTRKDSSATQKKEVKNEAVEIEWDEN